MGEVFLCFSFLAVLLLFLCYSANTEPTRKACIINYELNFFCDSTKLFEAAEKACQNEGSYMVKIDNDNMTKTINDVLALQSCTKKRFHLGATAFPGVSTRIWKWLDGSKVYLPDENGYQNWKNGQPNDVKKREDCLRTDEYTKQWVDSPCSGVGEDRYYICQKNLTLDIKIAKFNYNAVKCSATSESCVKVEWRRNNKIVSSSKNHSVYQVLSAGSSILHYQNATIRDGGEYSCITWVIKNTPNQVSASTKIKVNGTPSITKIDSSPCDSNLRIFWNPHPRALGVPHRIKVNDSVFGDQVRAFTEKPIANAQQATELSGLKPSTVYHIWISACEDENMCTDEYTVNTTATTLGIVIKNATMYQMNVNDTCIVTWEWPYNISTVFEISINSSSNESSRVNISELDSFVHKTGNKYIYSFEPRPEQVYEIQIQSTGNTKICPNPVKAVGSCMGEIRQTTVTFTEYKFTSETAQFNATSAAFQISDIVIPISAAGGGFVLLVVIVILIYCKSRRSKRNTKHLKENPIYGITNNAATESDYHHLHSTLNKMGDNNAVKVNTIDGKLRQNDASTSSTMVVNPLYGDIDLKTNIKESVLTEDQQDCTDAPIYAEVSKVEKKLTNDTYSQANTNHYIDAKEVEVDTESSDVYAVVDKSKRQKHI